MATGERHGILPLFKLFGKEPQQLEEPVAPVDEAVTEVCRIISSSHGTTLGMGLRLDSRRISDMITGMQEARRQRNEEEGRITPVGPVENA